MFKVALNWACQKYEGYGLSSRKVRTGPAMEVLERSRETSLRLFRTVPGEVSRRRARKEEAAIAVGGLWSSATEHTSRVLTTFRNECEINFLRRPGGTPRPHKRFSSSFIRERPHRPPRTSGSGPRIRELPTRHIVSPVTHNLC